MFEKFLHIFNLITTQDFSALSDPSIVLAIYMCVAFIIFIDSAFIPASPIPCDSIMILSGTLCAMGIIDFKVMIPLLALAGTIGSYIAYLQGHYLTKLNFVKRWIDMVPLKTMAKVDNLLFKHSFASLFIARFIPVVRPLTPLIIGVRANNLFVGYTRTMQAILSTLAWVGLLLGFGAAVTLLPDNLKHIVTGIIIASPIATIGLGVIVALFNFAKKKSQAHVN
ncbi:DedA family protein [Photobacterium kishitanii]|uniref:DedA family protein n=1 Tax=Photobacterium kishitanii TaxID=318456 RepID=A0A2T3KL22_9GAMM|nr:DedA family protein [Photobacterium kishitanii]PSV00391.1 DedA family protein [Photobacterium kishitanii]